MAVRQNQKPFNLYLPSDIKDGLDARADALGMSTSHLLRTLATEFVTGKQLIVRAPSAAVPMPEARPTWTTPEAAE